MALPVQIPGSGFSTTIDFVGPFKVSDTAYYVFGRDPTTATTLQAYKATDPSSSWSSIATKTGFATGILNLSAFQVGSTIHIGITDGTSGSSENRKYVSFDASTDTFGTVETILAVGAAGGANISIVVRSTGEVVAFYGTASTKVSGTFYNRVAYSRRTAVNTWTASTRPDTDVANNTSNPEVVVTPSDVVHFIWANASPGNGWVQRTLNASNVLQTASTGFSGTGLSALATFYDRSGTTKVAGTGTGSDTSYWDAGGNTPTLNRSTSNTMSSRVRVYSEGTDVWLIGAVSSVLTVCKSTDDGATFGSQISLGVNVGTGNLLCRRGQTYTRGSNVVLPYVYIDASSGGKLWYNEYVIRTSGVSGTLASTEAADAASFAGDVVLAATLATTEATDTMAFAGYVGVSGTLATTEAADTASFAGGVAWTGTLATTEATDSAAFVGGPIISATLATTEGIDAAALAGSVIVSGTLVTTEAIDTASFAGSVGAGVITGTLAVTEGADSAALNGFVGVSGSLTTTEGLDISALSGFVGVSGSLATTEAVDLAAISGSVVVSGTMSPIEAVDTAVLSGDVKTSFTFALTEASDTAALAGGPVISAALAVTESPDPAAFAADAKISATLAVTESLDAAYFLGEGANPPINATLAVTEAADTVSVAGFVGVSGSMGTVAVWDAATAGPGIVLSNGGLTVTQTLPDVTVGSVRGSTHYPSGKYYFEFVVDVYKDIQIGPANASLGGGEYLGEDNTHAIGAYSFGASWLGAGGTTTAPALTTGYTYCMAIDVANKKAWIKRSGGNWNENASADPVTGVNGATFSNVSGDVYPGVSVNNQTGQITANFGASAYADPVPSGYSDWAGGVPESPDSAAFAGSAGVSGSLAVVEAGDTAALSGDVKTLAVFALLENTDNAILVADTIISGPLIVIEGADTLSFTAAGIAAPATTLALMGVG